MASFWGGARQGIWAMGLAAQLSACHLVLDDVNPAKGMASGAAAGNPNTGGGGAGSGTPCTTPGEYRCNATSLEICDSGNWRSYAACPSLAQCDAEHGVCLDCVPGAERCASWRLETCTKSGSGTIWNLDTECKTASLCDVASSGCLTCSKDQALCNGALLYVCSEDQRDWTISDCGEARLCNARAKDCIPCTPGEYQCNGKSFQICDETQNWHEVQSCVTEGLCQATLDARVNSPATFGNRCVEPGCELGTFRCSPTDAAQIEGCPGDQVAWEPIPTEHCLTAALCNATTGRCDPGCQPGVYQCVSGQLQACRQDGTGYDTIKTCPSQDYCNPTKRDCVPCLEGEYQCSDANLQKCNADQTWVTQAVCGSHDLCVEGKVACKQPVCKLSEYRCNNGKELQRCAANRNGWETQDNCVTAALCDYANGHCTPPECNVGDSRCLHNAYQACDSTTRKWGSPQVCSSSQLCTTQGTNHCIVGCPTPNLQCSGVDLQRCHLVPNAETGNNEAKWNETVDVCATRALCSVAQGKCLEPACSPNVYVCQDNDVRICNADQTGWITYADCTAGQICDEAGHQCDNCTANNYTCAAASLLRCSTDGQRTSLTMDCGAADLCFASGATGYCNLCRSGEKQCDAGAGLRSCVASTIGQWQWGIASLCPTNICEDNPGNADYCAVCPVANEVQCVQSSQPGSTRTCAADRSGWSAEKTCSSGFGCVDNAANDYCASTCSPNQVACVNTSSVHTCSSDGRGWGDTISECADLSAQKGCTDGVLSGRLPCPELTPICSLGVCVACTGSGTECADARTSHTCNGGVWTPTACVAPTPVCSTSTGMCAECNGTSSICEGTVAAICDGARYVRTDCATTNQICSAGACVDCDGLSVPSCVGRSRRFCVGTTWETQPCSGATPACDGGSCIACRGPADCGTSEICDTSGQCLPVPAAL